MGKVERGARRKGREAALQILYQMDVSDLSAEDALRAYWTHLGGAKEAESFANQLVRGVRSGVLSQEAAKQPPGGGANLDFRGTSLGTSLLDLAAQGARAALSFKGGGA